MLGPSRESRENLFLPLFSFCTLWLIAFPSVDKFPIVLTLGSPGRPSHLKILNLKTAKSLYHRRIFSDSGDYNVYIFGGPLVTVSQLSYGLTYHSLILRHKKKQKFEINKALNLYISITYIF